jgi:hypothetical protein
MASSRKNGRKCRFEALEPRRVLAGNVLAHIVNNSLILEGDGLDNAVTIAPGLNPGQVVVTGVTAGGSPTRINGSPNAAFTLSNFSNDLKIQMEAGNDSVTINSLVIKGNVKVKTSSGDDTVTLTGATGNGSLKVKLGSGSDVLTLTNTFAKGTTKVKAGSGNDIVTISNSAFKKLSVGLGKGNDTLSIVGSTVGTKTALNGGSGTNTFNNGAGNFLNNLTQKRFG